MAAPQVSVSKRIAVVEVDEATRRRYPYKPPVPLTVFERVVFVPVRKSLRYCSRPVNVWPVVA